ncbi:hypothetical protein B0H16DRAFT_1470592 [Mycena metata]|uniref:Uncharacterized protein n=1 Tax=Mycena metata TaxID=1033252 RepID=A0AAD7HTU7_9AGAR|nr:hypothetical protein B0H16DRAFT_1470592 [Mycena metata]
MTTECCTVSIGLTDVVAFYIDSARRKEHTSRRWSTGVGSRKDYGSGLRWTVDGGIGENQAAQKELTMRQTLNVRRRIELRVGALLLGGKSGNYDKKEGMVQQYESEITPNDTAGNDLQNKRDTTQIREVPQQRRDGAVYVSVGETDGHNAPSNARTPRTRIDDAVALTQRSLWGVGKWQGTRGAGNVRAQRDRLSVHGKVFLQREQYETKIGKEGKERNILTATDNDEGPFDNSPRRFHVGDAVKASQTGSAACAASLNRVSFRHKSLVVFEFHKSLVG